MKISYITIVLNGMPFLPYCLEAMLSFAHEIIVVEGAVPNCMFAANEDGSSKDGTVEFLQEFSSGKSNVKIIRGKWPGKCEMQNEALKYTTGDYVWLVDSDEFYRKTDISKIIRMLDENNTISQINFIPSNFWKGFDYIFDCPEFHTFPYHYRRLFKNKQGAKFCTHRPPTMVWEERGISTEQMNLVSAEVIRDLGISLLHYSYVLPKQVWQKNEFYGRMAPPIILGLHRRIWYDECFMKWTPENRQEIEQKYSTWTGNKHTKTKPFMENHPDIMLDYINEYRKKEYGNGSDAKSN